MIQTIDIRIRRQDTPDTPPYWQAFSLPYREGHNIVSTLMAIREHPFTQEGRRVEPVVWEFNCMEEVCGACSMVINGRVRQACSALIDSLLGDSADAIELRPMTKFPVVRDLVVNRTGMFESLKKVRAWVRVDGYHDLGPVHEVEQVTLEVRGDLDIHGRTDGRIHLTHFVHTGMHEPGQDIVAVGGQDQPIHR